MINFKTMTSLAVLATLGCGEKAFAVLNGPLGDTINKDPAMFRAFKAPVDVADEGQRRASAQERARAMREPANKATVEAGLHVDIKAAFMTYYMHDILTDRQMGTEAQNRQIALKLQAIEGCDIATNDFAAHLKTLNKGNGRIDPVTVDQMLSDLTDARFIAHLVSHLDGDRLEFLFLNTTHGLIDLPGAAPVLPGAAPVLPGAAPAPAKASAIDDYAVKKAGLLGKLEESRRLEDEAMEESRRLEVDAEEQSKLDAAAADQEMEELLAKARRDLEVKKAEIAKKADEARAAATVKRVAALEQAYNEAEETVTLFDSSLSAMMKELDAVWKGGFEAISAVSEVLTHREVAARNVMERADKVSKTAQALALVTDKESLSNLRKAANVKAFLDHQRDFLNDPANVPYTGLKDAEIANAARDFCKAQSAVKATEKDLSRLRRELDETLAAVKQLEHITEAQQVSISGLIKQKQAAPSEAERYPAEEELARAQYERGSYEEEANAIREHIKSLKSSHAAEEEKRVDVFNQALALDAKKTKTPLSLEETRRREELNGIHQRLKAATTALNQEIIQLAETLLAKENEVEMMTRKIAELSEQPSSPSESAVESVGQINDKIAAIEKEIDSSRRDLEQAHEHAERLRVEISQSEARLPFEQKAVFQARDNLTALTD